MTIRETERLATVENELKHLSETVASMDHKLDAVYDFVNSVKTLPFDNDKRITALEDDKIARDARQGSFNYMGNISNRMILMSVAIANLALGVWIYINNQ